MKRISTLLIVLGVALVGLLVSASLTGLPLKSPASISSFFGSGGFLSNLFGNQQTGYNNTTGPGKLGQSCGDAKSGICLQTQSCASGLSCDSKSCTCQTFRAARPSGPPAGIGEACGTWNKTIVYNQQVCLQNQDCAIGGFCDVASCKCKKDPTVQVYCDSATKKCVQGVDKDNPRNTGCFSDRGHSKPVAVDYTCVTVASPAPSSRPKPTPNPSPKPNPQTGNKPSPIIFEGWCNNNYQCTSKKGGAPCVILGNGAVSCSSKIERRGVCNDKNQCVEGTIGIKCIVLNNGTDSCNQSPKK